MTKGKTKLRLDQPASYQIRVQGIIPARWCDYTQGMEIIVEGDEEWPVTRLTGRLLDQAALLGLLNFLYDQRLPLLSVACLSIRKQQGNWGWNSSAYEVGAITEEDAVIAGTATTEDEAVAGAAVITPVDVETEEEKMN